MLELRHLYVLRAIAREGSLAGAARSLHHSQPTVTHHLATLERHFGTELVRRGPRGAQLTDTGSALLPHAEAVIERLRLAEREVRDLAEQGTRTLHVGAFPTAGALLLPPVVKALRAGGVNVSLTEGELPVLLEGLRARELHAALVFSQPGDRLDLDGDFDLHPLLQDPLLLALPPGHPCAELERVPLGALREEEWIGAADPADPCDRLLAWACARRGFEPAHSLRTDDYAMVLGFVAAGAGVAVVPRLALGAGRSDIEVRPLEGDVLVREISAAVLRTTAAPALHDFLRALTVQAQQIDERWGQPVDVAN
ncbi:LysR family transcriptional regulator [Streptomyces sp. Da 82-17]|uniref:LysR family transcriptional regulator n=1 Tax=Streptomyces sp. Da 82-17 TaxID=3377116 RepID=UPI0038D490AB